MLKVQAERTAKYERELAMARGKAKPTDRDTALIAREKEKRAAIARGVVRTARKMVAHARTLWRFAVSRGYAGRNVADDVKKPTAQGLVETGVIDTNILTPAEVERLIAVTAEAHRCAVRFPARWSSRYSRSRSRLLTENAARVPQLLVDPQCPAASALLALRNLYPPRSDPGSGYTAFANPRHACKTDLSTWRNGAAYSSS